MYMIFAIEYKRNSAGITSCISLSNPYTHLWNLCEDNFYAR